MDFQVELTTEDEQVLRNAKKAYIDDMNAVANGEIDSVDDAGWRSPNELDSSYNLHPIYKFVDAGLLEQNHEKYPSQWRITQLGMDTLAALDKAKETIPTTWYQIEDYWPFEGVWKDAGRWVGKETAIRHADNKSIASTRLTRVLDDDRVLIWPDLKDVDPQKHPIYKKGDVAYPIHYALQSTAKERTLTDADAEIARLNDELHGYRQMVEHDIRYNKFLAHEASNDEKKLRKILGEDPKTDDPEWLHVLVTNVVKERDSLKDQLKTTEQLLDERNRLLAAIPECEQHGQCVPHALEWVAESKSIRADYKELVERMKYRNIANWWVMEMLDGGFFAAQSETRPDTTQILQVQVPLGQIGLNIAANSYRVISGPHSIKTANVMMETLRNHKSKDGNWYYSYGTNRVMKQFIPQQFDEKPIDYTGPFDTWQAAVAHLLDRNERLFEGDHK